MKEIFREAIKNINIENIQTALKLSIIVTPIYNFYAPISMFFYPLLVASCLDIFTGILKNRVYKKQPLSSKEFIKRKPMVILLWAIGLTAMLLSDKFLSEIGITGHWGAKLYCVFYGIYEIISILENISEMGLPGANGILKILKGKLPNNINEALESDKKGDK